MNYVQSLEARLQPNEKFRSMIDLVFRLATSLIFIIGGLGHFGANAQMVTRIEESPWRDTILMIGDPVWLLWLSGAAFIIFGIFLALGFLTRASALIILFTLIPITIAVHIAPGHTGPLFKNIAIMGALLYFYANGPGRLAIDQQSK